METKWDSSASKHEKSIQAKVNMEDWQSGFSTIQDANKYLLVTGTFSDVTFVVGEDQERIYGHRFILMSRSSVFEAMLERWTPYDSEVVLEDTTVTAFNTFLKFLYTNEFCVEAGDAVEVTLLAHKYNAVGLMGRCSTLLQSTLNTDNAAEIYQVAAMLEQEYLQEYALEFIIRNATTVLQNISADTTFDTLTQILTCNKLDADELCIFRAVIRWAELVCDAVDLLPTSANKRFVAKELIPLIRFPLMKLEAFTDEVLTRNPGFLNDEETSELLAYMNSRHVEKSNLPLLTFNKTQRLANKTYSVKLNYGELDELSCPNINLNFEDNLGFSVNMEIWITSLELNSHHLNSHFLRDLKTRLTKGGSQVPSFVHIVPISTAKHETSMYSTSSEFQSTTSKIRALDLDPVTIMYYEFPVRIVQGQRYKVIVSNRRSYFNSSGNVSKTGTSNLPVNTTKTQRTICTFHFYFSAHDETEHDGIISKINFKLK